MDEQDVFYRLKAAHQALLIAVDQIGTDNSVEARKRLFDLFAVDWRHHQTREQDVLYPRMRQIPALKNLAHIFQNELDEIERVLRELENRQVGTEAWVEHFEELRDLVGLHCDRMADEGFPALRRHLTPAALESVEEAFGTHGERIIRDIPAVA